MLGEMPAGFGQWARCCIGFLSSRRSPIIGKFHLDSSHEDSEKLASELQHSMQIPADALGRPTIGDDDPAPPLFSQ